MKKIAVITLLFLLVSLITSVTALAYNFTASDFKTSVVVKINGNTYPVNNVNGTYVVDHFCYGHEKISVSYTVTPLVDIANKKFVVNSSMINPIVSVFAYYHELGKPYEPHITLTKGNYTTGELPLGPTNEGPYKIVFRVNGSLPIINKMYENYTIFRLYIENGSKNCFSPVVVKIININKLGGYISKLKTEIQSLKIKINNTEIQIYLNKADSSLNAANTLYQSKVYDKAYQKAVSAEYWLKKAKQNYKKLEAENIINTLKTKIDMLKFKIQQIESDLYKVGNKLSNSQLSIYLDKKSSLNQKYNQYLNKLNNLNNLMNSGNYTEVISQGSSLIKSVNGTLYSADSLLSTLENIVSPSHTNTTITPTSVNNNGLGFVNLNKTTLELVGGVIVVIIVVVILLYLKGGGGFDELR